MHAGSAHQSTIEVVDPPHDENCGGMVTFVCSSADGCTCTGDGGGGGHNPHCSQRRHIKSKKKGWKKHLTICRSPSTDSVNVNERSRNVRRCSSTGHSIIHVDNDTTASSDMHVGLSHVTPYGRTNLPRVSPASTGDPSKRRSSTKNSAMCPCFSPNHSDDEEGDQTSPVTRPWFSAQQFMSAARVWRTRLAQENTEMGVGSEPSEPGEMIQNGGIQWVAAKYPVHTSVEFTHYLVPHMINIANAPYYHGVMDRYQAEKLLADKAEGTFLLRDSAQTEYLFSVSFRRYQRTLHARIEQLDHRFSFDSYDTNVFSARSVTQLIEHYKDPAQCLFFEPQLTTPLHRTFVFPLQHLCRAVINNDISYNHVNQLLLPKKFKEYLKEYHYKQPVRITNLE